VPVVMQSRRRRGLIGHAEVPRERTATLGRSYRAG